MKSAFKAYDIRGIYNKDFNAGDIYKIGFFLPSLLNTKKVLIGMDVRLSSEEIYNNLAKGINDAGADVYFSGLTTTPMIYWATAKFGFDASVMITASHNPSIYNGLKISTTNALPVGFDSGLKKLLDMATNEVITPTKFKGRIIEFGFIQEYLKFLSPYKPDLKDIKIAIDCSNGMGSLLIKELLGTNHIYLYDTLDGTFPNHEPNPLEPQNVEDLKKAVLDNRCDLGIIFDGDADRVMFTDEKGQFIQPDLMIAILADYYSSKGIKGKALQDIRTSKSVTEHVEKAGFKMDIWRVGRAYAALKLREIDGIFGGELAGHYYFKDFYYSDSAYLAALIILGEISKARSRGVTVSQLINSITKYYGTGEINYHINDKDQAINKVVEELTICEKPVKVHDFDGFRVEYEDWWFNIRPSNTEPYLRLIIEAKSIELLSEKTNAINKLLEPFITPYTYGH